MAVLLPVDAVKVDVLVNGEALPQYEDEDERVVPNSVTKYIEAQSSAEFAIVVTFAEKFHSRYPIEVEILLDGRYSMSKFFRHEKGQRSCSHIIEGPESQIGDKYFVQRFRFRDFDVVEGYGHDHQTHMKKDISRLGSITVSLGYIRNLQCVDQPELPRQQSALNTVSEKQMKGDRRTLQTSLGALDEGAKTKWWTWDSVGDGFFATVHFKYRSRQELQSLDVISRDLSPTPFEERPLEDRSLEELLEYARQMQEQRAMLANLKHEADNDEIMMTEVRPRKRARGDSLDPVIID